MVQATEEGTWGQSGSDGGDENQSDLEYILKVEPIFIEDLNVSSERKR